MKVYDICRYQQNLSIADMKKAGADAVIIRLAVGDAYKIDKSGKYVLTSKGGQDSYSAEFIKQCEVLGMPYGFYFYSYALTSEQANKEIQMFIGTALKYKNNKYRLLPSFFDMEEGDVLRTMTLNERTNVVRTWLNACAANGLDGAVYGNASFFYQWISTLPKAKKWLAAWTSSPQQKSKYLSDFTNIIGWQWGLERINGNDIDTNEWFDDIPKNETKPMTDKKTETTGASSLKVGDSVKVRFDSKTYEGRGLASFVYVGTYEIMELVRDRAVIGQRGAVTAAVNVKDLYKA